MRTSSAKAKGRRLQQYARDAFIAALDIPGDDLRSTSMGAGGEDLQRSSLARRLIPFGIECKNTETLSIYKAIEQALTHCKKGDSPLVIFSRNHSEVYAAIPFKELIQLLVYRAEQIR